MTSYRNFLISLSLFAGLSACKSPQSSGLNSSLDGIDERRQAEVDLDSSDEFRNIFATLGKDRYSSDELQKILFLPPPSLYEPRPSAPDPKNALTVLQNSTKGLTTEQIYEYSKNKPVQIQVDPFQTIREKGPITFLVVPGLFTEFTESFTFNEILANDKSSLTQAYQKTLKAQGNDALKSDLSFDLGSLADQPKPMADLVKAASFDDANGKALINVVYLNAMRFSGESFGPIDDNAKVYLRRADKYFKLMGMPENLYIVGQSRGAMVVLEMIHQAKAAKPQWYPQLKGMISLVGILYGTPLVDAVVDPKDPLNKVLGRIAKLGRELEVAPENSSKLASLAIATRNSVRWGAASVEVTASLTQLPRHAGLKAETIATDVPHLDPALKILKDIAFEEFNFVDPRLENHFSKVQKFKWILNRAVEGVKALSTASRIEWWKTHVLPADIKYFAIGALLPSATVSSKTMSPLLNLKTSYDTRALDYRLLRTNYYDILRYTGNGLNDGQAVVERSRFDPQLQKALNPGQPPLESYYLGIAGVDHWGIGFPVGFRNKSEAHSPFPREILAKSMAVFVSRRQ